MKRQIIGGAAIVWGAMLPWAASAHVVVKPSEVGVGAFQTFATGVPNEKEQPTVAVRVVIPEGLEHVSPNVKPGWTIEEKKTGTGEEAQVTEISWTGGQIPEGQRDDFVFSGQAPGKATELHWKAYQTYADGTVVSWDQTPGGKDEDAKPYSTTKVVEDLAATADARTTRADQKANGALVIALAALALAVVGLRRRH